MIINTKFDIGDTVWYIQSQYMTRRIGCVVCDNSGKVTLAGQSYTCPHCKGECQHEVYAGHKFVVMQSGKVGKITIELLDKKYVGSFKEERKLQYMLSCTGVGSGSLHDEANLFHFKSDAQDACDRLNSGTNFADDVKN